MAAPSPSPFRSTLTSEAELRTLYAQPHPVVVAKERPVIDAATKAFIERATFLVIGTVGVAGADVSPRGGPSGFVRVLDDRHLVIGDLPGNNRLDTMRNIVETGHVGLLFVTPGKSETVRVNGRACITTDPDIVSAFPFAKPPQTAIGVEVEATFIHCAKAFMRSGMWDPQMWAQLAGAPDGADIFACQRIVDGATAEAVRRDLDTGYREALAAERA